MVRAGSAYRRRQLRLGLLAVSVPFLASGCMWGVVRDSETGSPVPGVTVSYLDATGNTGSTVTDTHGLYVFDAAVGPVPATGPVTFELNGPGHERLREVRTVAYDDKPNASSADPVNAWEVQNFSLEWTYSCLQTLVGPPGPMRAARGIDRVPTGPDAVNGATCTFKEPIREITLILLYGGEVAFQQRIVLETPSPEVLFPLPDELVELVPTDLEPGAYDRQIRATTVEGETIEVALGESAVWVD